MKSLFSRALRHLFSKNPRHAYASYSQEGEDMILRDLLQDVSGGFYVDIGAYHPSRFSNTKFFYDRGWSGINIEPCPDSAILFGNQRKRDINLNVGISAKPGQLKFFTFDEGALNTFDAKRVAALEKETSYRHKKILSVPVDRLENILDRHATNRKIDFMNIDVEWHEMDVLISSNWEKYRPKFLLIEILNFSLETIRANPLHKFLVRQGYAFECKTPRTCFYRDIKGT